MSHQTFFSRLVSWKWHWDSAQKIRRLFQPILLFVPFVIAVIVLMMTGTQLDWMVSEATQEIAGPSIVALALFISLISAARKKRLVDRWFVALFASLLCREIHFAGTSTGIYVALIVLVTFGSTSRQHLPEFYVQRWPVSLMTVAFITYGMAVTVDAAWWRFLPAFGAWRLQVEETLESTGHLLMLGSLISASTQKATFTSSDTVSNTSLQPTT